MPEVIPIIIPGHCIVIGAGIAGACAAVSLARRGWQVTVLDAGPTPACGASGLPAGLYAPYLSADHNLTSQITASGVPMVKQLAQSLLIEGVDWQPSGVLERKSGQAERWYPEAGWLKPAALVQACLAQPGVTWRGNCDVKRLVREGDEHSGVWAALDAANQTLAQAKLLVIAAAQGSADLLSTVPEAPKLTLQPVRGQVTYGDLSDIAPLDQPKHPVNGNGSFIATDTQWMVGAGYDRYNTRLTPTVTDQVANFERLQTLLPTVAESLKPRFQRGEVRNWVGVRCTYRDRLPIVGQVASGLWLCTALASRGLTLAPLCAELLAAQLQGEPLPLGKRQARALGLDRLPVAAHTISAPHP
ncbi:MAG: FAD-dependent oxidoreductase [Burkholderiaceae bacterium]|nr:FAD-dependent oxidoreductase [Burkholderiaceae bacterium]